MGSAAAEQAIIDFLRRRYARAVASGDDQTAARLRAELDRLMNGRRARAGYRVAPEAPELPPAA
jgi:hypothetical protein